MSPCLPTCSYNKIIYYCFLLCSKIIGHVISDVYQFAQSSVTSLWTISCQLLQTGLLRIKQVCFWEAKYVTAVKNEYLKDPGHPPPFSMPLKLLIIIAWWDEILLLYCKLCSWKCMFDYLLVFSQWFPSFRHAPNRIILIAKLSHVNKNKCVGD